MKKDLKHYLSLPYSYSVQQDDEVGFFVEIPELPGCCGDGKTIAEAIADVDDSKKLWLETAIKNGMKIPLPFEMRDYSGEILLGMPRSLHRALVEEAKAEKMSLNQYLNVLICEDRHIKPLVKKTGWSKPFKIGKTQTYTLKCW